MGVAKAALESAVRYLAADPVRRTFASTPCRPDRSDAGVRWYSRLVDDARRSVNARRFAAAVWNWVRLLTRRCSC